LAYFDAADAGFLPGHLLQNIANSVDVRTSEACAAKCLDMGFSTCAGFQWRETDHTCGLKSATANESQLLRTRPWHLQYAFYSKRGTHDASKCSASP